MIILVQLLHPSDILIQKEIKKLIKQTCKIFVSRSDSNFKPVLLLVKNTKLRSIDTLRN